MNFPLSSDPSAQAALLPNQPNKSLKLPFRLTNWKWFALFLMNFILLGNFYCYDNPQALETHLVSTLHISSTQFNLLYSIIALPNIILPFLGGFISDYFGVRNCLLLFQSLVTIGQAVFTYGAYTSSYTWMLAGRLIYALGTDTQTVAQNALASQWFKGKEQAFAVALSTTMFGLGSTFDTFVTPRLQEYAHNLYIPTLFGFVLCLISQLISFGVFLMDRENEKREVAYFGEALTNKDYGRLHVKDLKSLNQIFWFLTLNYGLAGSIFFTFTNIANDFVSKRFGFDSIHAGNMVSSIYIAMSISAPLFGFLTDKKGRRVKVMATACILGICVYAMFTFLPDCHGCYIILIPLSGLGIYLGMYDAGMYGSLPLVVESKYIGTGFGLLYVAQNIMMTIIPLIVGKIQDTTREQDYGYLWVCVFMIGYSCVTLVSTIPVFKRDKKINNLLNDFKPASGTTVIPPKMLEIESKGVSVIWEQDEENEYSGLQ